MYVVAIIIYLLFVIILNCNAFIPNISTEYGEIQGFTYVTPKGFKAEIFLGIPYAQPPICDLRFEKPQPPLPWTSSPLKATKYGFACVANIDFISKNTSEDCLTLNIFKPSQISNNQNGYPVLVFIHGGAFVTGSSADYDYKEIIDKLISRGVVLVSMNYRVGPFGFFTTGDSNAPGNYGLWDQIEALKFIQKVIPDFNGNPSDVSILGVSAGAASVSWLTLSPVTKNLFHRAISMSGSALIWANRDIVKNNLLLLNATQCLEVKDPKKCLKEKSANEITEATKSLFSASFTSDSIKFIPFYPRFDNDLFKAKNMDDAIAKAPKRANFIGFCRQEYSVLAISSYDPTAKYMPVPLAKVANFSRDDFIIGVQNILGTQEAYGVKAEEATKKIVEFYETQKFQYTKNVYLQIHVQLYSDVLFNIPQMREAKQKAAAGHEIYFYVYDFVSVALKQDYFEHAGHLADHINIFGTLLGFPTPNWTDSTVANVQKTFADFVVNFVKSGMPSSENLTVEKVRNDSHLPFVNISSETTVKDNLWPERFQFWNQMADDYGFDWPESRKILSHTEL